MPRKPDRKPSKNSGRSPAPKPSGKRSSRQQSNGSGGARRNTGRNTDSGQRRQHGRGGKGEARTGKIGATASQGKGLGGEQIEGRQAVRELLMAQTRRVHEVWISTELEGSDAVDDIVTIAKAERVPVAYVARKRLENQARTEAPQGVLALAAPLRSVPLHELLGDRPPSGAGTAAVPFLVAIDGVTDPGNLGAIIRNCDGAGVTGVILPRHRAVHVTPTVAKSSAGAVEYVPLSVVSGLASALLEIKAAGVWVVGLDDDATQSLFEFTDFSMGGVCIVLGAEGAGLSRLVRERCDLIVSIPMRGSVSSLNVSAATALATYEIARHTIA